MWRKTSKNKGENQQETQLIYAGFNTGVQKPRSRWWEVSALTTVPPLLAGMHIVMD